MLSRVLHTVPNIDTANANAESLGVYLAKGVPAYALS